MQSRHLRNKQTKKKTLRNSCMDTKQTLGFHCCFFWHVEHSSRSEMKLSSCSERDFRSTSSSAINSPQLYRRNWCHHAPTHRKQSPVQFLRMCLRIRFPGLPIAEFQSRVVKPPIPFFPISSHLLHQQQQQKPEIWIRYYTFNVERYYYQIIGHWIANQWSLVSQSWAWHNMSQISSSWPVDQLPSIWALKHHPENRQTNSRMHTSCTPLSLFSSVSLWNPPWDLAIPLGYISKQSIKAFVSCNSAFVLAMSVWVEG
jgi:hypothetical protein